MHALGLNIVELLELVRVCGSLQVDKCTASFLSDYLAAGLAVLDPELAVKVRRFDEDELEALADRIKKLQTARRPRISTRDETVAAR